MKPWIRRLMFVVFWVSIGALLVTFMSLMIGQNSNGWLFAVLLIVAIFAALPLTVMSGEGAVAPSNFLRPGTAPTEDAPRTLARIESIREVGVTRANMNHLFEFIVTEFPDGEPARRVVFSQFITLGQLPNLASGNYIILVTISENPTKYLMDPRPAPRWKALIAAAPQSFDRIPAAPALPVSVASPARKPAKPFRVAVSVLVILGSVAIGGFLALVPGFGSVERGLVAISEFPQRLTGTFPPTWDSPHLDRDLAVLQEEFVGRQVEALLLFDTYLVVYVISDIDPEGIDQYVLRGGEVSLGSQTPAFDPTVFDLADVDAGTIRQAISEVRSADPDAVIENVQYRVLLNRLTIDVDVAGTYQSTGYRFDAATGELLEVD